ncbi:zinc finger protein 62 homolog isoform X10 [Cydia pomonella]|uniref:zinc finger protein 62 homolog isoform X10 n=1 Tax=Cydia pomonella TaxID=82600 RepID=UPI002ADE4F66|nr:zinc finger protein 62 homolog isoform X10 [Cydia pomonella]
MDFDEIVVKESPGLCRCCLSEGCYKDLGSEYSWMSETEIYADMLLECFDISISQHPTGPNGSNRLICEVCITRLRDACNFKKQVLESEKKFVDMVGRGEFRPKVLLYQTQMKTEHIMELEEETGADDSGEVEYLEEDTDFVDEDLLKNEDYGEASVSEDITVSTLAVKGKRGRPKKTAAKPEKKAKVAKTEEKPKKAVAKDTKYLSRAHDTKPKGRWTLETKQRNIESVLLYSNLIPFIWFRGKYKCFYCTDTQKNSSELRCHYETHDRINLTAAVKKYTQLQGNADAAIKVEITNLYCKLCSYKKEDLDELIQHLIDNHDVDYDLEIPNCFLPFRLAGTPSCGTCHMQFDLITYLVIHANNHLKIGFICEICGKCFITERFYSWHLRDFHKEGGYECKYCDLILPSNPKKTLHERTAHQAKVYKCSICDETLKSSYLKNVHLSEVHRVEENRIKCPHCPKVFPQANLMVRHVKCIHQKVRQHVYAVGPPTDNEKHVNFGRTVYNTIHIDNRPTKTENIYTYT